MSIVAPNGMSSIDVRLTKWLLPRSRTRTTPRTGRTTNVWLNCGAGSAAGGGWTGGGCVGVTGVTGAPGPIADTRIW